MQHRKLLLPILLFQATIVSILLTGCSFGPTQPMIEQEIIPFPPPPNEPRFYYEKTIVSSSDVIKETEDQAMQRWLTGSQRVGEGMGKPFGIAVHRGRLFVSDVIHRAVLVFDPAEEKYFKIGEEEPGKLVKPMGIDVDIEGNLYVMDATQQKVFIYDRDGTFLRSLGSPKQFDMTSSIAVSEDGSRVYVVDTGGVKSSNHRVSVFNAHNGDHINTFGSRGSGDGEFNLPKDAAVGPDGLLYIVDSGNFRIQVMDPTDGSFVRTFGDIGRRPGQFSRPKGVDTDSDGNIYVSDAAFGNLQIFNAEGQLLLDIGSRSSTFQPAKYMLPAGITVDEDGRIYLVDQYFKKIDIFRPASLPEHGGYLYGEHLEIKQDQ